MEANHSAITDTIFEKICQLRGHLDKKKKRTKQLKDRTKWLIEQQNEMLMETKKLDAQYNVMKKENEKLQECFNTFTF